MANFLIRKILILTTALFFINLFAKENPRDLPGQTITLTCDETKAPIEDTIVDYEASENNETETGEFIWPAGATSVDLTVGEVGNSEPYNNVNIDQIIDPVAYPNPVNNEGHLKINTNYRIDKDLILVEKVTHLGSDKLIYNLDNLSGKYVEGYSIKGNKLYKEINGNKIAFYSNKRDKTLPKGIYFLKIKATLEDKVFNQSTKGFSKHLPAKHNRDLELELTVPSGQSHTYSQTVNGTHINFIATFITESPIKTEYSDATTRHGHVGYNRITFKEDDSNTAFTQIVPNEVKLKLPIFSKVMMTYCDSTGVPIADYFSVRLKDSEQVSLSEFAFNKQGTITYLNEFPEINNLDHTWELYYAGGGWLGWYGNLTQENSSENPYLRFIQPGDMNNPLFTDERLQEFIDILNTQWVNVNPDLTQYQYFMTTNSEGQTTIGYTEGHPEPVYCPDRDSTFVFDPLGDLTVYHFRENGTAGGCAIGMHDNSNYVNHALVDLRFDAISAAGIEESLSQLVFETPYVPNSVYNNISLATAQDYQLYWANQNHDGRHSNEYLINATYQDNTANYEWCSGNHQTQQLNWNLEDTDKITEDGIMDNE